MELSSTTFFEISSLCVQQKTPIQFFLHSSIHLLFVFNERNKLLTDLERVYECEAVRFRPIKTKSLFGFRELEQLLKRQYTQKQTFTPPLLPLNIKKSIHIY